MHRGFSDDVTELRTVQPGGALLTDFQKDKFRYFFFHVLDLNSDNVISSEDFDRLNEVSDSKDERRGEPLPKRRVRQNPH